MSRSRMNQNNPFAQFSATSTTSTASTTPISNPYKRSSSSGNSKTITNPYKQQRSASSSTISNPYKRSNSSTTKKNEWFTTKKRGRDDDKIKRDQQKAMRTLKQRRATATRKPTKKKKREKWEESEEEDGSEDSFVVGSDESISEQSSSEEEEEEIINIKPTKTKRGKPPPQNKLASKQKAIKNAVIDLSDEEEEDDDVLLSESPFFSSQPKQKKMKNPQEKKRKQHAKIQEEKKEDEEEDPLSPLKTKQRTNRRVIEEDSDDDIDDDYQMALRLSLEEEGKQNQPKQPFCSEENFMEEEEATAFMLAIKESEKTAKMEGNKLKRLQKKVKSHQKPVKQIVIESSSSEGEKEDDQQDEYMECDDSKKQAGSILKKANELSATLLQTMTEWSLNHTTKQSNGKKVPCGIIVDGALALSTLGSSSDGADGDNSSSSKNIPTKTIPNNNKKTTSANNNWISNEVMQQICPQLKLADYQLIGVNWLALLHGMTCNVNDDNDDDDGYGTRKRKGKKKNSSTSVNGVLADEMGLGKTVQTIAFLAWLRHHNQPELKQQQKRLERHRHNHSDDDDSHKSEGESSVVSIGDDDDDDDDFNAKKTRRKTTTASHDKSNKRPHIIIVPASVLSNWEREFNTFCPEMTVVKYHGNMTQRKEIQHRLRKSLIKDTDVDDDDTYNRKRSHKRLPLDVVLTTFSYFSTEKSDDRNFLRKFHFDYMVVDEAHCLKNPRGMRYKNMDKFVTSHRLLLTGTPVQNSPKELMSLLCFLMPLFTRQQQSVDDFEESSKNDGGEKMLEHFVTLEKADVKKNGIMENPSEHAYRKLKQLLAPFILRRRKSVVLSQLMPPKTRTVDFVPFDDGTRAVYDSIISNHIKNRGDKIVTNDAYARQNLFVSLRKAANHPLLLRMRHKSEASINHLTQMLHSYGYFGRDATCTRKLVKKELEKFSDYDIHCAVLDLIGEDSSRRNSLAQYILQEEDLFCSPKFVRLHSLLPQLISENHRMLIFSQWTRCLDLLGCLLESMDLKFLRLDGQTAISERQHLIDEFNCDPTISVFLLSTRAGGMGKSLWNEHFASYTKF